MATESTNTPVEDPLEKLLEASKDGSVSEIENYLKRNEKTGFVNYSVNSRNESGLFPLFVASSFGHDEVIKYLIQKEAKVDLVGPFGMTALSIASEAGHTSVVQSLSQAMANVNHVAHNRLTPLMLASRNGYTDTVEVLLNPDRKADVNLSTHDGLTALMLASKYGHVNIVKLLLPHVSNVDARTDRHQLTALMLACAKGHSEVAELLLDPLGKQPGAKVDLRCSNGYTSLLLASHFGHHEVAKLLLNHSADVDRRSNDGMSALIEASAHNHEKVVKVLLEHNAQVDLRLYDSRLTALMIACDKRYLGVAKLLLQEEEGTDSQPKPNINGYNRLGNTPLQLACSSDDIEVAELLVKHGADVDNFSLLLAVQNGNTKMVEFLLAKGANPETESGKSSLPLLVIATLFEHVEIVELLLKHKCDPNAAYRIQTVSVTPLMIATFAGHHQLVEMLVENHADIKQNSQCLVYSNKKFSFTCFELADACGDQKIVQFLESKCKGDESDASSLQPSEYSPN